MQQNGCRTNLELPGLNDHWTDEMAFQRAAIMLLKRIEGVHVYDTSSLSGAYAKHSGAPDIICCVGGLFVAIELKCPPVKQSQHQKNEEARVGKAGGKYAVAETLAEVIDVVMAPEAA